MHPTPLSVRVCCLAPLLIVLLSATVAVVAYLQALNNLFMFDDTGSITGNPKLLGLHGFDLWHLFLEPFNPAFEFLPLRELSFWLDINLFGLNPAAFRMHNILLYLLCLPLIYGTTLSLWRYFRPADAASAPWAAAVVTALFAVHPALVESVVWISGRKYVLPNLFAMLALWLAVHARREQGLSPRYASAALVAFVAMMLSKTSYVAVAPVIALLWLLFWLDLPPSRRRRSQLLWPLALLLLAGVLVRAFILVAQSHGGLPAYFGIEAVTRTLAVLGWLARLAASPENRHFFYPVFEDAYLPLMVTLGVVVLAGAAAGLVRLLRKRSLEGFALVVFLLLCLPYAQLIPYVSPSLVQDRYLSLAVWPVILLIVAGAWRLKPVPRAILLLAFALPWTYQTTSRTHDWRSFEAIIDTDLRAYPGYYIPAMYKILGFQLPQALYRDAAETANSIAVPELRDGMLKLVNATLTAHVAAVSTNNPRDAMTLIWSLGLDHKEPPPTQTKWNLPFNLLWGKRRDALKHNWEFLAAQFPDNESVRYNAGLWLLNGGYTKEAAIHLRAATESQHLPQSVRGTAFKNLGLALLNSDHAAAAEIPLRAALEQSPPDLRAHCSLATVYKLGGRMEEAALAQSNCDKFAPAAAVR